LREFLARVSFLPSRTLPLPETAVSLSPLRTQKLNRMFDALDVNRDGVIRREDFDHRVAEVARINGWPDDAPQLAEYRRVSLEQWEGLVTMADANEDREVTREELLQSAEVFLNDRVSVRTYARGDVQLLFDAMDTDRDGKVTLAEYRRYLEVCGVDASAADAFFAHVDLDENGRLSRREMSDAVEEYLLGEDPTTPGNFLFGPLDPNGR
jgi:Ca2+-binding EF-hand superfamily protein